MPVQQVLICAMAIVANVNAQSAPSGDAMNNTINAIVGNANAKNTQNAENAAPSGDAIDQSCTRICSRVEGERIRTDPHCHQRCQADIHNCIESTLPYEERDGERYHCFQKSLLTAIREEGSLLIKLAYDVEPTFGQFDELYTRDGKFDSRDAKALDTLLHGRPKWFDGKNDHGEIWHFFFPKIPEAKIKVVMAVYKEADQDGDGVVTEGEFNAYVKDSDTLSDKEGNGGYGADQPDMPDLIAKKQSVFRSKQAPHTQEKKELKRKGLTYFQHLLHLGLRVYREEEKLPDPIEVLASELFKAEYKTHGSKVNVNKKL